MIESQPCAFGNLTVRSLLDMREHCLMEFDFHDVYLKQKQLENKAALSLLPSYLEKLQSMDFKDRHEELALGFLAGNVFDWGAKEVALLMEADKMDFEAAKKHVGPRPWLIDNVDPWLERMEGEPHNCCCVFIDNSGADFLLGVVCITQWYFWLRQELKELQCALVCPFGSFLSRTVNLYISKSENRELSGTKRAIRALKEQ